MRMLETRKREWLRALRSGNYPQGREQLEKSGKFCCLGVLAHQCWKAGEVERLHLQSGSVVYGDQVTTLGEDVLGWAGASDPFSTMDKLMIMNDDQGMTFSEIADWIEENVEGF